MKRITADVAKTMISKLEEGVVSTQTPKQLGFKPFPIDVLPEPIARFVTQAARAFPCDPAMIVTHVIAVLGAAIGTTRRIQIKGSWFEYPIVWTAVVAPSGRLKSPPHEAAIRPVHDLQQELMEHHNGELEEYHKKDQEYERQLHEWKKGGRDGEVPIRPVRPKLRHILIVDTTVEAIAPRLEDHPRGLLLARDELSGLFAFDSYKKAKGNDVAHYLEMHRGGALKIDRKTGDRTTIYVPRAAVSICGTIQPSILKLVLGKQHFQNGFAARTLITSPPTAPKKWSEAEISKHVQEQYHAIVRRLFELQHATDWRGRPVPVDLPFSSEAKRAWVEFYDEHGVVQAEASTQDLAAAFSKLEAYAARFALIVHLVRGAAGEALSSDDTVLDEMSITAGIALARWFVHETERVYELMGSELDDELTHLVTLIQNHGGEISARELTRKCRKYPTADEARDALIRLGKAGMGTWHDSVPSNKGGAPKTTFRLLEAKNACGVDRTPVSWRETMVLSASTVATC